MGIIDWLNANNGAIIGVATVVLVIVTGYYAHLTRRLLKAKDTPEVVRKQEQEVQEKAYKKETREEIVADNNSQLSYEELRTLADALADKFMEFVGPDFNSLSDDAVSREGIYEDYPSP